MIYGILEYLYAIVSTVHNNNVAIFGDRDATWVLEISLVFSKSAKRWHKLAVCVEDLYAVIMIVAYQNVVLVITRNAFWAVKQSILRT